MQYTPSQAFEILYDHYCAQMLTFLQQSGRQFGILCDEQKVRFDPPLAKEQAKKMGKSLEFLISGSTFESLDIRQDSLGQISVHFVVGLTPGGDGEQVSVRVRGIYQIFIKDTSHEDCALFTRVDSSLIFPADSSPLESTSPSHDLFSPEEQQSLQAILQSSHNRKVFEQLAMQSDEPK